MQDLCLGPYDSYQSYIHVTLHCHCRDELTVGGGESVAMYRNGGRCRQRERDQLC
jgi:hypothetical protein